MRDRLLKILRMLGLISVLALGFVSIVGSTHDDDDNTTTTTTLPQATTTTTLPPVTTTTTLPPATTTTTLPGGITTTTTLPPVTNTYTVGGSVSGLNGTLVLQNNGGDDLSITADGPFAFATELADGSGYNVTVSSQPTGQTCFVSNGINTINAADVTDIQIVCLTNFSEAVGQLDTTFSDDGIAVHDNAANGVNYNEDGGASLTLDSLGNVFVTGYSYKDLNDSDMVIWKYLSDGTLDPDFGTSGVVVEGSDAGNDSGSDIALDSTGSIIVVGDSFSDMAIWKYLSDGTPDTNFGTNGVVIYDGGIGAERFSALIVDSSDNIFVTGYSRIQPAPTTYVTNMKIMKYDSSGTLDPTFGDGGIVSGDITFSEYGTDIVLDSAGNIFITGFRELTTNNYDMIIWKYTSEGILDDTFGTNGIVLHAGAATAGVFDEIDQGTSIALDQTGNIYVAGRSESSSGITNFDMVAWKYTSQGVFEGNVVHDGAAGGSSNDAAASVTLDPLGNIYIAGYSINAAGNYDMIIWKYTSEANLDNTFGINGIVVHGEAAGGGGSFPHDSAADIELNDSGNIFITGRSYNAAGDPDMVIWKYE
jgi:uncharacterized delta-60 repeat protein